MWPLLLITCLTCSSLSVATYWPRMCSMKWTSQPTKPCCLSKNLLKSFSDCTQFTLRAWSYFGELCLLCTLDQFGSFMRVRKLAGVTAYGGGTFWWLITSFHQDALTFRGGSKQKYSTQCWLCWLSCFCSSINQSEQLFCMFNCWPAGFYSWFYLKSCQSNCKSQ